MILISRFLNAALVPSLQQTAVAFEGLEVTCEAWISLLMLGAECDSVYDVHKISGSLVALSPLCIVIVALTGQIQHFTSIFLNVMWSVNKHKASETEPF